VQGHPTILRPLNSSVGTTGELGEHDQVGCGADRIVAYNAVEIGRSTEVVDKPGSKIVCRIVNPILSTVRVGMTLLPARLCHLP
jgi:hypothetical protein